MKMKPGKSGKLKYGTVSAIMLVLVLAGLTAEERPLAGDCSDPSAFLLPETQHTYSTFVWQQNTYRTLNQPVNFRLIPLYDVLDEPYTVCFTRIYTCPNGPKMV